MSVHVGQDVGGRNVTISAEEIERYGVGTSSAPPPGAAPALLFHSEVYRDLSWYLPNLVGNLHGRQEWEMFAPMQQGDEVRSRVTVVERYTKRGREYVVAEVLWTDPQGRWLQRSRTHQSFPAEARTADEDVVAKGSAKKERRGADIRQGEGERLPSNTVVIDQTMCDAFSGPAKNYHNDREQARALGFPDIVVQGMMSICFAADLMTGVWGDGFLKSGKLDVKLVGVVWIDEEIHTHGRIRERIAEGDRTRVIVDVWCEKADGTLTLVGEASALEPAAG